MFVAAIAAMVWANTGEGHVRFALVPSVTECERAAERIRRL